MIFSVISNALTIIIGFIVQKVFLDILGTEYLGINSLYNNIISMLAIAELGIGTAIIYNLYEPVAHNKKEKIKSLMNFYKKTYRIISLIILYRFQNIVNIFILKIKSRSKLSLYFYFF